MKIIAVVLILSSSLMIAYIVIQTETKHSVDLDKTIEIMILIKNNAIHYSLPFQDIIKKLSTEETDSGLDYIQKFILLLPDMSPPEAWQNAVIQSHTGLTRREMKEVISLGSGLCSCSREQIPEISEKCICQLESYRMELNNNKEKRIKTATALSLSVGLIIVLIFI